VSNIKWVLLLISPLLIASSVIRPTTRVTEPAKVEQHILVQDEVYRHLSSLKAYQDSNYVQWGVTQFDTSTTKTISLGKKYLTPSSYAAVVSPEIGCNYPLYCTDFTDSSFIVHNLIGNPVGLNFSWITVGEKK
jgi:hypothetical protein